MDILQNAVTHFDSREVHAIEVPEWGDDEGPAVIYFRRLTMRQKGVLYKKAKGDDVDFLIRAIIFACMDAEGKKLFDVSMIRTFMDKVDPDVASRIANAIIGEDGEELGK